MRFPVFPRARVSPLSFVHAPRRSPLSNAGYVGNALQYKPPAVIAYEQTSADGETKGDLVFGTRSSTSGTASATPQLRVRSDGVVEVDANLQVDATSVFNEQVNMFYGLGVGEFLEVSGTQTVTGASDLGSTLRVRGDALFDSKVTVVGKFVALGDYQIGDNAPSDSLTVKASTTLSGATTNQGATTMLDSLDVHGASTLHNTLTVSGAATMTSTLALTGAATLSSDITMTSATAAITHTVAGATNGLSISSTNGWVDVETVRFTGNTIGISGDTDIFTLTSGAAAVAGTLGVSGDVTVGTSQFTVTATNGNTAVAGTLGVTGATSLSSASLSDDITMSKAAAALTHSGTTSLTVSSTNGFVSVSGGTYVDVESVRFTGNAIGISGDTDIITLTSGAAAVAGTLGVSGNVAVNTNMFTVTATNGNTAVAGTLGVTGATTLSSATLSDDITMSKAAAALTHSGTTSLTVSSTNGFVSIAGATGSYVDVESIRFTDNTIGINGDTDIITLTSATAAVAGALTVSTTLGVTGVTTLAEDLAMSKAAAALTHSGTTSLTVSSTNGFVSIAGATGSYVDVESIRFTDNTIGINGDTDIITLTSATAAVAGALTVSTTLDVTGAAVLSTSLAVGGTLADASKELYVTGDIYATGTSTAASDSRYKRDVENIVGALDISRQLRPVTFSFRTEDFADKKFPEVKQAGVIAQEMEKVLPHLVTTDDAGYKGVAYERLGVYAMAGVKELDAKDAAHEEALAAQARIIAAQEEKIAAQEEKMAALQERVNALAAAVEALTARDSHSGGRDMDAAVA